MASGLMNEYSLKKEGIIAQKPLSVPSAYRPRGANRDFLLVRFSAMARLALGAILVLTIPSSADKDTLGM